MDRWSLLMRNTGWIRIRVGEELKSLDMELQLHGLTSVLGCVCSSG